MTRCFVIRRRGVEPCEYKDIPVVADGAIFPDGRTVVAWRGETPSTAVYDTVADMFSVHAHDSSITTPDLGQEMGLGEIAGEGGARIETVCWWQVDRWGNYIGTAGPVNGKFTSALDGVPDDGWITLDSPDDDDRLFTAHIEDLGEAVSGRGVTREAALSLALWRYQQRAREAVPKSVSEY